MPTGPMRTRSVAICCTVGFLVMLFTTLLNIPPIIAASDAHFGKGDVVTYTFNDHRCTGGDVQYRSCGWIGTVTRPGASPVTNVFYRDTHPPDAASGLVIKAIWSPKDKHSAYDIEQSDAWTAAIASTTVAAICAILFFIGTIVWWRRVIRNRRTTKQIDQPC